MTETSGHPAVHSGRHVDAAENVNSRPHAYTSTACLHGLHANCRNTCKFCDAPCRCPQGCHAGSVLGLGTVSWVDQARDIARYLWNESLNAGTAFEMWERVHTDPDLFWLRGEEQPPGEHPASP